jgi:RNA polymerase sigma-70 factor (ECF subfamily)
VGNASFINRRSPTEKVPGKRPDGEEVHHIGAIIGFTGTTMATEAAKFDAFYRATSRAVLHQMYAMTGNIDDARECVQEAYTRAWQHWSKVSCADDPAAWLRTVAWRIAASRWRRARTGFRALTRIAQVEHAQPPSLDHVSLVAALRRIPEEQRQAIVLFHLVGMSVRDVAEEVRAPIGTVKARLARGRAALAVLLTEESGDEASGDLCHSDVRGCAKAKLAPFAPLTQYPAQI